MEGRSVFLRSEADVAMVPAAELAGSIETAHLLRAAKNAERLLTALRHAGRGQGRAGKLVGLRRETGLRQDR